MKLNKRWFVLGLLVGTALVYSQFRRREVARLVDNIKRFSAPSTSVYDAVTALALGDFYHRVAEDLAGTAPRARVLEVGSGPGRLATILAAIAPEVHVSGIDIVPEMVERANARAAKSGVTERVTFEVGDVAALPFPDATFDVVVSTLSLHHWANPARGLSEIYRVLRPGGVARIYDVVDWIRQFEQGGPGISELAESSPFGERGTFTLGISINLGPIPLVYRADLRHA
ncbi:MAG TPA: class I SAM-dependent methyltransferase [Chloroflexota bacterium]|nr:class I SAM-dependent methyltransferase [Chloroflexota bacterium]